MSNHKKFKTRLYDTLQDVDQGISTPEQALSELVKEVDQTKLEQKVNKNDSLIPNGLYKIHWKSGGFSLASIGRDKKGEIWIAPTNWINGSCKFKDQKDSIEFMNLLYQK